MRKDEIKCLEFEELCPFCDEWGWVLEIKFKGPGWICYNKGTYIPCHICDKRKKIDWIDKIKNGIK